MNRYGRALAAWILGWGACAGQIRAQMPLSQFDSTFEASWAPMIFRQWSLLFREFQSEFYGCLYGLPRNDTLFVVMHVLADLPPSWSTPTGTRGSCPPFSGFLGTVHSHPPSDGPRCAFSDQDLVSFRWYIEHREAVLDVLVCRVQVALIHWRLPALTDLSRCEWDPERVHGQERLKCETLNPPALPALPK